MTDKTTEPAKTPGVPEPNPVADPGGQDATAGRAASPPADPGRFGTLKQSGLNQWAVRDA